MNTVTTSFISKSSTFSSFCLFIFQPISWLTPKTVNRCLAFLGTILCFARIYCIYVNWEEGVDKFFFTLILTHFCPLNPLFTLKQCLFLMGSEAEHEQLRSSKYTSDLWRQKGIQRCSFWSLKGVNYKNGECMIPSASGTRVFFNRVIFRCVCDIKRPVHCVAFLPSCLDLRVVLSAKYLFVVSYFLPVILPYSWVLISMSSLGLATCLALSSGKIANST